MAITRELTADDLVGRRLSIAEYLALPEIKPYLELVDGRVEQKLSTSGPHSRVVMDFAQLAAATGTSRSPVEALPEARLVIAEQVWVPDLVVYASGKVPLDAQGEIETNLSVAAGRRPRSVIMRPVDSPTASAMRRVRRGGRRRGGVRRSGCASGLRCLARWHGRTVGGLRPRRPAPLDTGFQISSERPVPSSFPALIRKYSFRMPHRR
jgi:hypothetical protein